MNSIKSLKLTKYIVFIAFIIILLNPIVTLAGAKSGLLLWFNVIIPSLLPSIIISNIIISVYGDTFKNPFLYIVFTGLLCGYPLGAATTVQLSEKRENKSDNMQFIMAICNNSSPMFITNYIIFSTLNQKNCLLQMLIIIYFPILLLLLFVILINHNFLKSSIFKLTSSKQNSFKSNSWKQSSMKSDPSKQNFARSASSKQDFKKQDLSKKVLKKLDIYSIDTSIMTGFEIVTKLGGYIILFSIFGSFIQNLPINNEITKCIVTGFFEITTGINSVGNASFSMELKKLLVCTFTAFGGLSCIAQTQSIIQNSDFTIKKYIYHKLIITMLTLVTAYFMIYVL